MTTLTGIVVAILAAGVALLGIVATGTRMRLTAAERRVATLERQVGALDTATGHAVDTARAAATLARRAAGAEAVSPPRVVLEPVTGRLVKALAVGAGARRAVTRLARPGRTGP